ncbi:hypothetical protein SUGI_1020330 [Cryptomeria japonica]|uniref:uncharacterized protein LOC131059827 n=1 Tax=Cryptomeria japonica TaxID=3369 RepID=UPI0024149DE4|nr:uncharacterized protein LOC131059827 [Cryptomeria japonica]GLJ48333.1 hypothetical protein SUGI_1020330 [Cryptomeria japonica]
MENSLSVAKIGSPRRFQSMEFHYDSEIPSNSTTPYVSAPSSPGRSGTYTTTTGITDNNGNAGGFYFSAPTSPTRSAAILSEFAKSTRAVVPFMWEEKPGIPKKSEEGVEFGGGEASIGNATDFEFSARFSLPDGGLDSEGLLCTADELFCNGQIRPLRLPPRLQQPARPSGFDFDNAGSSSFASFNASTPHSPRSPRSPRSPIKEGRRMLKEALSGLTKGGCAKDNDFDPFAAALQEARKERCPSRRRTRSLSPLRVSHWEEPRKSDAEEFFSTELQKGILDEEEEVEVKSSIPAKPSKGTKRWSLKDFLFRSASEGRAQSKDRLWGLSIPPAKQSEKHKSSGKGVKSSDSKAASKTSDKSRQQHDDLKGSHGKSAEDLKNYSANPRSGSFSKSGRRAPISPHELHYTANRAQSEELRKRTFLPYRQGLLGCLGFSSKGYTAMNGLTRGLNTVS